MPYTVFPIKIQTVKANPHNVPTIAPFEFANGMNIPKQNSPNIGPPITPNNDITAFKIKINFNFKEDI